ncbi:hypothetical protein J5H75_25340 [Pseudomonas asiatica]|uniref:hypothetical protein n=1 Tax=Pseudomonas asiatica TaxID=2219225 RepID=UPI001AAE7310|nr:hypothetical protein [Pseudomonas asiatica]MBO2924999.1 hypothetical protein [Pseudomonas asiatica]
MELQSLLFMLELQLNRIELEFKDALLLVGRKDRHKKRYLLEGVLSSAWQSYCSFVRLLAIHSSLGCKTSRGATHPPSIAPVSWERASYVALRAAKSVVVHPALTNSLLIKEPTWGDSSKIHDILTALNPGNVNTLKSYLAGGLNGPKHCQQVRNACAHNNHQTRAEVQALAPFYTASKILYPTDAMTWKDPHTQDFAFISWLDDMRTIASGAVS